MHYYSFKQVAFYYLSTANTEECTLTSQQNIHGWVLWAMSLTSFCSYPDLSWPRGCSNSYTIRSGYEIRGELSILKVKFMHRSLHWNKWFLDPIFWSVHPSFILWLVHHYPIQFQFGIFKFFLAVEDLSTRLLCMNLTFKMDNSPLISYPDLIV